MATYFDQRTRYEKRPDVVDEMRCRMVDEIAGDETPPLAADDRRAVENQRALKRRRQKHGRRRAADQQRPNRPCPRAHARRRIHRKPDPMTASSASTNSSILPPPVRLTYSGVRTTLYSSGRSFTLSLNSASC